MNDNCNRPAESASRRSPKFKRLMWLAAAWTSVWFLVIPGAGAAERPNILWITAEDMSPDLGCYADSFATTPNLDRFATESVRFTHAFATAPVCSPARSCLITGMYATSLGTQRLRSHFPVPRWCRPFPADLRRIGYFTSNNVKTDYNVQNEDQMIRQAWDVNGPDAHWRRRNANQPFFSVFNLMTTHQSRTSVWSFEQFEQDVLSQANPVVRHDPNEVRLPPYYPDTPLVRRTVARYYDCIAVMDQQVDRILRQLEDDGLAEDTIVFFFSDHGMGMPRGKRTLYDSGMHVPLIIRFPAKYQHLAPGKPGSASDRLVSFVDFPPTVLRLAGVEVPTRMQGRVFLGPSADSPRTEVFGARDRVDEAFDVSRSLRDGRYLYIRNYMPHLSWMPPERYSDNSPMRRQLFQLRAENALMPAQLTYAAPHKPAEELYDVQRDPHQIHNLAADSSQAAVLQRMRSRLKQYLIDTRDVGFLPESDVWRRLRGDSPRELAQDANRYPLRQILAAAERVDRGADPTVLVSHLSNPDPAVRYWSIVALHVAKQSSEKTREALHAALQDESPSVRIAAADALLARATVEPARTTLMALLNDDRVDVVLRAIRTVELNKQQIKPDRGTIENLRRRAQRMENASSHPNWMFVRFSAEAILE